MDLSSTWNNTRDFLGNGLQNLFKPQPQQLSYQQYSDNDAFNLMQNNQAIPDLGKATTGMGGLWNKFQGSSFKEQAGAIGGLIGGIGTAYNAYNTVKTANEQLAFTKDAWNKQYQANANLTNASLADRQNARVASNSSAYQSVDNYMKKYGVK